MTFLPTISNDEVAALPTAEFAGRIVVVDDESKIEAACRDLSSCTVVGFDTETRPSFKAGVTNKVSLLQLSTPETCYLFRLNRIRLDNRILKILTAKRIVKVGADVAGDMRSLHVLRSFREQGFVDLQQLAAGSGIEEKSLRKLAAITLGLRVSKAQRLSNWGGRDADPAADDVCRRRRMDMYRDTAPLGATGAMIKEDNKIKPILWDI